MGRRLDFPAPAGTKPRAVGISDQQLVTAAQAGNLTAYNRLLRRYHGFVKHKASAYFLTGGDRDDLVQEGMIGLCKAVRDFQSEGGASFRTFAELCITRQIITAVKTSTRGYQQPLNQAVPFDRPVHQEDNDKLTVGDTLTDGRDTADAVIFAWELRELPDHFTIALSRLEAEVLRLFLNGHPYDEIAAAVNGDERTVDNALQRVRRKGRAKLEELAA